MKNDKLLVRIYRVCLPVARLLLTSLLKLVSKLSNEAAVLAVATSYSIAISAEVKTAGQDRLSRQTEKRGKKEE